jgi:SAM-dependent methyltransferase
VTSAPRWFTDTDDGHSEWYADHFRELVAEGVDIQGEARLIDALIAPGSRVLDAGCGQGRIGAALHDRGHRVVGVDIDEVLLEAARADHPGPDYVRADLTTLDLESAEVFDAIVCAGNVITFVAPGAEVPTLISMRRHLAPDGVLVVGFQTERYAVADFDRDLAAAGLVLEHRFATWHLGPWSDDAEFAVSVIRDASRTTPLEESSDG